MGILSVMAIFRQLGARIQFGVNARLNSGSFMPKVFAAFFRRSSVGTSATTCHFLIDSASV
jgi:hypothetical protein